MSYVRSTNPFASSEGPGSRSSSGQLKSAGAATSPSRASAVPSAISTMSGYGGANDAESDQDTEPETYTNGAEPWKQSAGGLVAPRTFAARFFVTRLGFMRRKCRRMMAFTSDRLYVVRVDDGKAKASYPLKSVQLAPSDKVNPGKGIILTSDIGNVRHSFKCRDRTSLLAAFAELQDAARDRPLNLLFQVIKRSKTRGDVKMTLRVGPTSLDRVDGERLQHRVSSLPLLSVEKVYLFTDDATQMLVDCHGGRRRRYWCAARDSLVRAMEDHLRHLGRTGDKPLPVERVGTWEVDTSASNPDSVKQGYLFELPVQKWSRTERAFKNRVLALTKSSVVEMDVVTREHLREFPLKMIFNIVYHTPGSSSRIPAEDGASAGDTGFSIEVQMAWGSSSTYTFQPCRCSAVSNDSIMAFVLLGEGDTMPGDVRKVEERQFRGSLSIAPDVNSLAETGGAGEDGVCGFYDLRLTPVEARAHFLANFLEVCRLNHHGCPWSLRRVTNESRVGELTEGLHPDYQEFLLKRTTGLSAIARAGAGKVLADPDARGYALAVLDELNVSTPITFKHKEKGAAAAAMALLAPSALQHFDDGERVSLLLAVLRLLWSKTGYDEVTRAECQPAIDGVFKCLASEDHTVSYPAALVIRSMLTHPRKDSAWWAGGGDSGGAGGSDEGVGADRKLEKANRKAIFGQGNEKQRLEKLLAPCFAECMKPEGRSSMDEDFGSDFGDSDGEDALTDDPTGEGNLAPVTMAGVGPPPAGPECLVQSVLMEVLVILVSSGDKQADRAVVQAVWELLHEFDAMCQLLSNLRSPCLPLAKASMQLLSKMHNSKRFSVGPRSILQDTARDSGALLWVMFLAMDAREPDMCRVAGRLCRALTDGDARSLAVLTRSFPPGLLVPSPPDQLFNECGASVWSTTVHSLDATELHARWDILSKDVRDVEVVWSPVHRDALGQLLLEQLQELERETRRLSCKARGGRAPPEALAWNDAAWEVPWHNMVGEVKVGRYFLEQLIADLDSSKESSNGIRKRLSDPTALGNFLQLCHLRLLHERDASSLELVFDTMTCLFQHLGSRAVPMVPFLGSVLHMLTYSLPAILGPVGAAEESPSDAHEEDEKEGRSFSIAEPEPRSGAQATATYYAAVQFVRVCMDNQPANVRLFVMHGGVETFVELVGSAFQHAHSLSASSSSNSSSTEVAVVPPLAITNGDGDEVSPSGSSGSEEHFGPAGTAAGGRVPRRERASDMSVALTCRELVVECISCLSSALEVFPAQDVDGKMFFPKSPPKRQLANPIALAALVDLLASEEEAVLHPALTLLVTVVRGGLEVPLSAGARGRIVVRCLRHACEGRCAELCAELLGAEAVAAPPARLSDGGMGGAVGPVTGPREGAVLARSPLYPLLPGALVRLMVTKGARAFAEALLSDGLETPTVVWNSECRHMLGVVLRELEGATPGLQDVPAIEVQEAGRRLEVLYSEKGGVPVLFTSPYYVQLMDETYRIEYPSAFLLEVASSMAEVLQGPPEQFDGRSKGRVRCISTPLENEGDVIYLHEPLLWTLRQHATNGVVGPDSLARAIAAVTLPLLEITARVAVACSFSPEALTSLSSFTESLSLCMGFLARAKRLSALCFNSADGSMVIRSGNPARRSNSRRRSSVGGRRRSLAGGALEDGPTTDVWTVAIDLRKVDALLTMLKQLDDQESAGYLMAAGNQVLETLKEPTPGASETPADTSTHEIPGLTNYIGGLVSAMGSLEAPTAILSATAGIGFAAFGLGKDTHIDLLYKSQVYVPLIAQCLRPQVSEERPGGNPGLGLQSARTLKSLAESEHEGINSALTALLTPGGMAVLRRSPEEMIRVLRSSVVLETPKLIWGPKCRDELEEMLKQSAPEEDGGGHRGRGAVTPITSSRRCRRFKPKELDGFVFEKLRDELVVDDIYLRVLVRDAARERASAGEGEGGHGSGKVAAAAAGLGQGLELPSDLLASVFVYLGDQMRLIVAGQVPTAPADRELFFQDVSLLLQALLGLAVGEDQVPEVIEDSGDALNLLWAATQPYLRDGLAGPVGPSISRSVVELVHVFLTKGGPTAGDALVASGAVAPIVHACGKMLPDDYDLSPFTQEDGVAALHVAAMLLDLDPAIAKHMVTIGAVPLFLSRACHNDFPKTTRVRAAAILHRLCVSVPAASIGLGRVMPELLLLHLEADPTGESLITHLDDKAACPILVWDTTCRDRLSSLTWAHWEDWRRRVKVGASLRWVPAYLPEEVLLPSSHSSEPCVAGLYFRLYAAEPGFALEKDMVEGFLVCSVEAMLHGRVADDLLPVLLEALYYALACLGDGALAGASRKANGLWPILFSLLWKEMGLGHVRFDPSNRPARGVSRSVSPEPDKDLTQSEAVLRWGARIVCLLASVPVHWTIAGAGSQVVSDEHALSMVHSDALDDHSLGLFLVTARAVVASKTDEGMDVAHHFVSPLVLRSLVDKLANYTPPTVKRTADAPVRQSKYGLPQPPPSPGPDDAAEEEAPPPPPTVCEDLVIKLLACLMVHPQQGQRARLVLRDELPEAMYMALHRAGSIPADIKGDSSKALPPLPHRDTDHKLYPKKGNAAGGAAGAEPMRSTTGGMRAPESLVVPLRISVSPDEEETPPVTVTNIEAAGVVGEDDVAVSSDASPSPVREGSLRRSVVAALKSQRGSESSRLPSIAATSASGRETAGGGGGGGGGSSTPSGKSKGLWQRASVSWANSPLNPANGAADIRSANNSPRRINAVSEERPLTSPVVLPSSADVAKTRAQSMRKLATRLSPRPAPELSPSRAGSVKGRSAMGWGTSSVASSSPRPLSTPRTFSSPKP